MKITTTNLTKFSLFNSLPQAERPARLPNNLGWVTPLSSLRNAIFSPGIEKPSALEVNPLQLESGL